MWRRSSTCTLKRMRQFCQKSPTRGYQPSNSNVKQLKKSKELIKSKANPYEYDSENREFPEPPTTCCGSACPNCVWLLYAEALTKFMNDNGEDAIRKISENVQDPNMRAFILHELRMRKQLT